VPSRLPDVPPRSIVVAQLAFIGDMVFATPLLARLREAYPRASLAVVGRPAAVDVLADDPRVDALVPWDKDRQDRGLAGLVRVARRVRRHRPDLFLGVTRSFRTILLAALSGARRRVGVAAPGAWLGYRETVPRDPALPFPARPLALLRPLGIPAGNPRMELSVAEEAVEEARRALRAAGWTGEPLLAVAPGAHYATKRWPLPHWEALLDRVLAEGVFRPALYGGPAEEGLIERLLAGRSRVLDRRGIGIRGVVRELAVASVFVGGDSGPAHIARAVGTPVVVLHGPTDPVPLAWGEGCRVLTVDLPCRPCSPHGDAACPEGHHRCMVDISPERVQEAIRDVGRTVV